MSGVRYAASFPRERRQEAVEWCIEHFGPFTGFKGRWMPLDYTIQFRDEEDRLFFTLRWL